MKFIPLTKSQPTFEEEVVIWTNTGYWFTGKRVSSTTTPEGTKHVFQCGEDGKSSEVDNATHYLRIEPPKE